MNPTRTIQTIAAGLALVLLISASMLVTPIRNQREDLQLALVVDLDKSAPPYVVLANILAGPLRGLVVDYLWYRANELKEDGKFYEANQLAQWITALQPQFGQVWSFQAWNMAYNISVETYTPEERWDWVQKGVNLLRQKGVIYNRNNPRIYRELGWIFFHKIGQYSDDMHWYYKRRMAFEWQSILGNPNKGATTQEVIDAFRKIAEAPETLKELREDPQVAALVDEMNEWGYQIVSPISGEPNKQLLTHMGRVIMFMESLDASLIGIQLEQLQQTEHDQRLLDLLQDKSREEPVGKLLSFMRKAVLKTHYNMDPQFMLDLMEYDPVNDPDGEDDFGAGPLDWRHPISHAAYWSAQGVQAALRVRNKADVDQLNMDRQVVHSMQNLTDFGRLAYDPVTDSLDLLPDPRFIPAYDRAMDLAKKRVESGEFNNTTADSFDNGHENFLLKAVFFSYVYGDEDQAQRLLEKARRLYSTKPHNITSGRYLKRLPEVVLQYMQETFDIMGNTVAFIDAMIQQAFLQGLANSRMDVFSRHIALAKMAHQNFQGKAAINPNAVQNRGMLLSFDKLLLERFGKIMINPQLPPLIRSRIWVNTPNLLKQQAYDRIKDTLAQHAKAVALKPELAFPEPSGMAEYRQQHGGSARAEGDEDESPAKIERK